VIALAVTCVIIKVNSDRIKQLQLDRETAVNQIAVSNKQINDLLDVNGALKGKYYTDIKDKRDSIETLKHKLNVQAHNIYNINVVSDDSITCYISNNIHNNR
jgi:hypothetical protein